MQQNSRTICTHDVCACYNDIMHFLAQRVWRWAQHTKCIETLKTYIHTHAYVMCFQSKRIKATLRLPRTSPIPQTAASLKRRRRRCWRQAPMAPRFQNCRPLSEAAAAPSAPPKATWCRHSSAAAEACPPTHNVRLYAWLWYSGDQSYMHMICMMLFVAAGSTNQHHALRIQVPPSAPCHTCTAWFEPCSTHSVANWCCPKQPLLPSESQPDTCCV